MLPRSFSFSCRAITLLGALTAAVMTSMATAASEPRIVCSNISPFAFEQQGVATGYVYEIGQEVMKRLKYTGSIKIEPLPRANRTVQSEANVIALWLGRIPEREQRVKWLYPILQDDFSIYTLKGEPGASTLEQALKLHMLGANGGAANAIAAQRYGLTHIEFTSSDDTNGRKLMTGRIDGWIATQSAVNFFLQLHALPSDSFIKGLKLSDYQAWVAASPATDPAIIAQWQKTLADMQRDGTLTRLASKYRVKLLNSYQGQQSMK